MTRGRRRAVVDPWGSRWTVRARRERFAVLDTSGSRVGSEFHDRLRLALSPEPPFESGRALEDGALIELEHWTEVLDEMVEAAHHGTLFGLAAAIQHGIASLTSTSQRLWIVELVARGRLRRGATWRATGEAEALTAAAHIADAVRAGLAPAPADVVLIHVVDHRLTVYGARR